MFQDKKRVVVSPSLSIALDPFSCAIAMDTEDIIQSSYVDTPLLQKFLYLTSLEDELSFLSMQEIVDMPQGDSIVACTQKDVFSNISKLKNELRSALHALQSHENLIRAGHGNNAHLPLNIYLLADFTLEDAGAFFPTLLIMNMFLSEIPYARGHLFVNLATFAEGDDEVAANANAYKNLQELDAWLGNQKTDALVALANKLDLDITSPYAWQVYLFDRYKEGLWEAKDESEIQIITGNFLLACLSSDLSASLEQNIIQVEKDELKAYFSSASASALLYNPRSLLRACAYKLGEKLLSLEFAPDISPDLYSIERKTEEIILALGTVREWVSTLLAKTPFSLNSEEELLISHNILTPDFKDLPMKEWVYAISAHHQHIFEKQMPDYLNQVKSNALKMDLSLPETFLQLLSPLPENSDLYPGGILASREVADILFGNFLDRSNLFGQALTFLDDDGKLEKAYEESLEKIERAIESLPTPPRWVLYLPFQLKHWGVSLYNALFLRKEYHHLLALREYSLEISTRLYSQQIEREVFSQLEQISGSLCDPADDFFAKLDRLSSFLASVQLHFQKEARSFFEDKSLFRRSILNQDILEYIYTRLELPVEKMRVMLLEEKGFFSDWKSADDLKLAQRLLVFCSEIYEPVWETSLNELLLQFKEEAVEDTAAFLSQGILPLLRLSFDNIGVGRSTLSNFFISAGGNKSALFQKLEDGEKEWQYLESNNHYFALGTQVRQMIPLDAVQHLRERGERAITTLASLKDKKEASS
jgi:hypothetical protein